MRRKGIVTLGLSVLLTLASTFSSFAGEWRQDDKGWWWQDGSWYPTSQWKIINGKAYYFGSDGYMLHDTVQDGFQLESSGAVVLPDVGLEVAPYKAGLDSMIANNLDDYNDPEYGFGIGLIKNETNAINWIDCGTYYKLENVKLYHIYEGEFDVESKDIGVFQEIRIRKDGLYLFMDSDTKLVTLTDWIKKGYDLPSHNVIFDDKGYVIGFWHGFFG